MLLQEKNRTPTPPRNATNNGVVHFRASTRKNRTPQSAATRSPARSGAPNRGTRLNRVETIELSKTSKIIKEVKEIAKLNDADTPVGRLITVHNMTAASILHELKAGNKTSHWAWWIFPTEKIGESDDLKTSVSIDTYHQFLRNIDLDTWREILQEVANEPGKMPQQDHRRIGHFCKFWSQSRLTHIPRWLPGIITTLGLYFS